MAGDLKHFVVESRDSLRRFTTNLESIISKYDRHFSDDEDINITSLSVVKEKGLLRGQRPRYFGTAHLRTTRKREQSILSECCSQIAVSKTFKDNKCTVLKDQVLNSSENSNSSEDYEAWRDKSLKQQEEKDIWGRSDVSPTECLHHTYTHIGQQFEDEVDGDFLALKDNCETALSILASDTDEPSDGETLSSLSSSASDWEDIEEGQTEEGEEYGSGEEEDTEICTTLSSCSEDEIQIVEPTLKEKVSFIGTCKHENTRAEKWQAKSRFNSSSKNRYTWFDLKNQSYDTVDSIKDRTYIVPVPTDSCKENDVLPYKMESFNYVSASADRRHTDTKVWQKSTQPINRGQYSGVYRGETQPLVLTGEFLPNSNKSNIKDETLNTEMSSDVQNLTHKMNQWPQTVNKDKYYNNNQLDNLIKFKCFNKENHKKILDSTMTEMVSGPHKICSSKKNMTKSEKYLSLHESKRASRTRKVYKPVFPEVSTKQVIAYLNGDDTSINALYSPEIMKHHRQKFSETLAEASNFTTSHERVDSETCVKNGWDYTGMDEREQCVERKLNTKFMSVRGSENITSKAKPQNATFVKSHSDRNIDSKHTSEDFYWPSQMEGNTRQISTEICDWTIQQGVDKRQITSETGDHILSTTLSGNVRHGPFGKSAKDLSDIDVLASSSFSSPKAQLGAKADQSFRNVSKSVPAKCLTSNNSKASIFDTFKKMKDSTMSSEEKVYKWITPSSSDLLSDRYTLKARRRLTLMSSPPVSKVKKDLVRENVDQISSRNCDKNLNNNNAMMSPKYDPYNFSKNGDSPSTHLSRLKLRSSPLVSKSNSNHNKGQWYSTQARNETLSEDTAVKEPRNSDEMHRKLKPVIGLFKSPSVALNSQKVTSENEYESNLITKSNRHFGFNQNGQVSHDNKTSLTKKNYTSNYVCISSPPLLKKTVDISRKVKSDFNSADNDSVDVTRRCEIKGNKLYTKQLKESVERKMDKECLDSKLNQDPYLDKKFAIILPQKQLYTFKAPNDLAKSKDYRSLESSKRRNCSVVENRYSGSKKNYGGIENRYSGSKKTYSEVENRYSGSEQNFREVKNGYTGLRKDFCNKTPISKYAQSTPLKANIRFNLNDTISTIYDGVSDNSDDSDDEVMTISPSDMGS